jgi:hypothetical protein
VLNKDASPQFFAASSFLGIQHAEHAAAKAQGRLVKAMEKGVK